MFPVVPLTQPAERTTAAAERVQEPVKGICNVLPAAHDTVVSASPIVPTSLVAPTMAAAGRDLLREMFRPSFNGFNDCSEACPDFFF